MDLIRLAAALLPEAKTGRKEADEELFERDDDGRVFAVGVVESALALELLVANETSEKMEWPGSRYSNCNLFSAADILASGEDCMIPGFNALKEP